MHAHDVKMIDTLCPRSLHREDYRILHLCKQLMVAVGKITPRFMPFGKVAKFHREPSRLNGVQPTIVAFDIVVILFRLAVVADHLHPLRHSLIVCRDSSALATGSQILAGIKTESSRLPHRTGTLPGIFLLREVLSAVRLARIFNDK